MPTTATPPHRRSARAGAALLRGALVALAVAGLLVGCRRGQFKLAEEPPAHREPTTTSIYGDWVLATPTDSTAFVGARLVEMTLDRNRFVLTATYPSSPAVVVRGTVSEGEGGVLTLTPQTSTQGVPHSAALVLVAGQPVTVLASAAGNTMVFSTPTGITPADPSSVWHRKEAAKAAGQVPANP
jgi:hypothetical protein